MTALDRMIRVYDNAMVRHRRGYYQDSGFFNFGYWAGSPGSQREASEALVDELLSRIAVKGGRILDVACGVGATTLRIADVYPPEMITAINISEAQIAEAQKRVPGCTFLRMDATRLEFPDNYFDAIVCVEAAFHFDTRDAFFREALRVLKPGGTLAVSDILVRRIALPIAALTHVPRANFVSGVGAYRRRLEAAGFVSVAVDDATDICLGRFRRNLAGWPAAQRRAGRLKFGKALRRSLVAHAISGYFGVTCGGYVLAAARKPDYPA